jgi:hypothetical protein
LMHSIICYLITVYNFGLGCINLRTFLENDKNYQHYVSLYFNWINNNDLEH